MKVREPVARPLDVVAAELLLTISQALVVGVLLYVGVGVWDERGVHSGSVAAILVALAFAVGAAWAYWLFGGSGLPLAAAELPIALFLAFAALLGLRGVEIVRIAPLALVLALAASTYGVIAGVFLDSPRRLRWDERRTSRRHGPVPRISPTTAAWAARVRGLPKGSSSPVSGSGARHGGSARPPATAASAGITSELDRPAPAAEPASPAPVAGPPTAAPTVAHPTTSSPTVAAPRASGLEVPSRPGDPARPASLGPARPASPGPGHIAGARPGPPPVASRSGDPVGLPRSVELPARRELPTSLGLPTSPELPTSVEPRAQKSPWAWARPPAWNRDDEEIEADRDADRP